MNHDDHHREALDPARDPVRWEEMVRSITAAAEPELASRAARGDPLLILAAWTRPLLAVAATVVILASATLLGVDGTATGNGDDGVAQAPALSEALVPSEVAAWLEGARAPTPEEMASALGENP